MEIQNLIAILKINCLTALVKTEERSLAIKSFQ